MIFCYDTGIQPSPAKGDPNEGFVDGLVRWGIAPNEWIQTHPGYPATQAAAEHVQEVTKLALNNLG